jgi:glycerol uptake facilitator-like aquaporin
MEAAELCALMFCICLFGALIYSGASPLRPLALSRTVESFLMGIAIAITTFLIIRSPFGRRTGAHFNPAITLAYFYLDRVHRWDTLYYVTSQFTGALVGVFVAHHILGEHLSAPPVCYVVTIPGRYGNFIAFVAESVLSGLLIRKIVVDLQSASLRLPSVDGVLMANTLHFIQEQQVFLRRLLSVADCFLIVEYERSKPNRWGPYPVGFERLRQLFTEAGVERVEKVATRPSLFGGMMYPALVVRSRA